MNQPNFYVVRLPEQKFQAASGSVDTVAKANQFPGLAKAHDAAIDSAKGISEYTTTLQPVRHLTMEGAEKELTNSEEE